MNPAQTPLNNGENEDQLAGETESGSVLTTWLLAAVAGGVVCLCVVLIGVWLSRRRKAQVSDAVSADEDIEDGGDVPERERLMSVVQSVQEDPNNASASEP